MYPCVCILELFCICRVMQLRPGTLQVQEFKYYDVLLVGVLNFLLCKRATLVRCIIRMMVGKKIDPVVER